MKNRVLIKKSHFSLERVEIREIIIELEPGVSGHRAGSEPMVIRN
jgi:hypothetical protein